MVFMRYKRQNSAILVLIKSRPALLRFVYRGEKVGRQRCFVSPEQDGKNKENFLRPFETVYSWRFHRPIGRNLVRNNRYTFNRITY